MATRPCYTFHSSFLYLYYRILSCTFVCFYSIIYFVLSYTFCTFFLCWLKANTFILYLYFPYYVNFYLIFHISRKSIRLIILLSYHILSYVFIYVSMCFHILYFSYTFLFFSTFCTLLVHILFVYSTLYFLYTVFMCCSCTIFIYLYSCTVHFIYCFLVILFI